MTPLFVYSILIPGDKGDDMEEKVKSGYLYDFYGELLNERQRNVYEMSVFEDMSLSEIADTLSISRQGVHDMLKRCDHSLEEYESRLHLVEKFLNIREDVVKIKKLTETESDNETLKEISTLSSLILEEL